jgi:hypothetical protein
MSGLGLGFFLLFKRDKIDAIFWKVLVYWLVVNFFSLAFIGSEGFGITTLIGSLLKLFIGYIFIKIFKEKFIYWFENAIFVLGLISIPFYLIQLYDVSILTNLPFNFVDPQRLLNNDWNGIIFNYQPVHWYQNSGFAGEPGTFGYYIGFAMIFNLFLNNGKITRRLIILLMVGLTTMSTNYYLSVMMFVLFFLLRSGGLLKYFAAVLFIPFLYLVFQLPFLFEKISEMLDFTTNFTNKAIVKYTRVNRFSYFLSQFGAILEYPFGYGINENAMLIKNLYGQVIEGTNGISRVAVRYGLFGFFFFFTIMYRFCRRLTQDIKGAIVCFLILAMYLGANPMERDYFLSAIFWMYFFVSKEDLSNLQNWFLLKKKPVLENQPNLS